MRKTFAAALLVLVLGLTVAPALHAQGCAMCYTTAAGQDPAAARKLDMAILALLVPVLVLFASVMGLLIHRRNAEVHSSASEPSFASPEPSLASADPPPATVRLHLEFSRRS